MKPREKCSGRKGGYTVYKYQMRIDEVVQPSQELQSSVLYHGTPTKAGYQGIASQGLKEIGRAHV